ncbi:MAG: type II toxin-antitoxin system Phd/YefM family antitoxin [Treponema sp.]|nr:type II toxin-antitoxin system Phd/YefM family antitoxin [Treponema sp.]
MMIETKQMMSITQLQKELTKTVRNLSGSGETVFVLKNNNVEAVLMSYNEYERLKEIEKLYKRKS